MKRKNRRVGLAPVLRVLPVLLVLAALSGLSGCFQSLVLLKVNKDGSGTLEETMLLTDSFTQLLSQLTGEQAPAEEEPEEVDWAKLEEKAQAMGEGVRVVSAEPVKNDLGSGYRAVFSFPDINQLRVNQNPGAAVAAGPGLEQQPEEPTAEEWLRFSFRPGTTPTLEVLSPAPDEQASAEQEQEEPTESNMGENPEMMQMMRQLYSDMRIRIMVEVAGTILDTNARYVDGSRVTLVDVDFGALLQDEARFQQLIEANPESVEEMEALIGDNPALRVETQEVVSIVFR